ncbi:uncharacterized protein LOC111657516 isoform X3 [Seriola lalandi dorsalis]|uniref:uncharacterized protein LOC111657516 isoform X3 n=1 Tax=Seriola lalandi dorsalis TaxID=1841481 RepID=UPI000C6F82D5|nr:uncharacterized protein LOC111657516 isoform X3 [Seriola lalandi dorsalis]XP_056259908.1 uncharacterized protein LOC130186677 isoform X2 [Seriola aureovittata]
MEVSPFSFTLERYWTEEKERALIAFFSKHSCLWNHKSESYKNRQLRWKTLEQLRILLSAHPPPVPFTVEDIKNKFKNLRTTFQRQYKMVKASKVCKGEDVFVPQWKHYQQLMFLQGCWDQDDCVDEQPLSPLTLPQAETQSVLTSPGLIISFLPTPSTSFPSTSSSCVPSNMMVKCYWTEERERALIAFYSEHNCLWNKKSENHNNRQLRLSLLEALRGQLSDHSVSFTEQSCLWNNKSESYRNRLLRQSLLETLSRLLSENEPVPFTVEDIKTKFRNLRTIFQREHKAVSSNKTCGSEDFYLPKWKHYQELMFLCDSCDEDERPEGLHCHQPEESDLLHLDSQAPPSSLHYHTATQTATKGNITPQSLKAPPSPTPPDSQHSSPSSSPSPSTSSSHTNSRLSGRKRASRRAPPTMNEMLDFMRMFCQSRAVSPHTGFMKYVEECLNEMPPDKVKKLKKKIIETIHSVSEEV